jgi:hypothetical protein
MNNLADRWDNALGPDKAYARTLRAEITCDPFEPTAAMSVRSYRNDQNQERWAFRCWGTDRCDGWLSLDHTSQESAERDRDRHVAEEHGAPAPAATEATDCWTQQVDGTWTLPVDGGTILFTQASTPEERQRFAANWAAHQQPEPGPAALRERYAAVIRRWWDDDDKGANEIADAVLAVRDREMEQLGEELDAAAATIANLTVETNRLRAELADEEEATRRILGQRQELAAERYAWQEHGDRLAATLKEVLAHFTHETHPGQRCLQTGHVPVGTVDRWRAALTPPKEPTP